MWFQRMRTNRRERRPTYQPGPLFHSCAKHGGGKAAVAPADCDYCRFMPEWAKDEE